MSYSIEDPPTDAPKTAPKTKSTTFSARDPKWLALILAIVSACMIGWSVYSALSDKGDSGAKTSAPVLKQPSLPKESE